MTEGGAKLQLGSITQRKGTIHCAPTMDIGMERYYIILHFLIKMGRINPPPASVSKITTVKKENLYLKSIIILLYWDCFGRFAPSQ